MGGFVFLMSKQMAEPSDQREGAHEPDEIGRVIGRRAGLKIQWPVMAVPVRSRLRVQKRKKEIFDLVLPFFIL